MQAGRTLTLLSRRPHPSLQANSTIAAAGTYCVYAMAKFSLRSNVESTGLSTGTTKSSPPRLSLRSRLGDLLSGLSERAALSASRSRMRLYGHLVCAHGPTLLTNPEPCKLESASFMPSRLGHGLYKKIDCLKNIFYI